jgi:hypothetical protein|tara:strand:+ start:432 stop:959 length:528 start_codon:yes stop_codon:yes gene_type:complete
MDPATIALAITAARTAVGAAKGIQSIGHSLEGVFKASEEHKKKKAKKKPKTRMQQVLRMRSGDEDYDDETSISAVANQVLEEKQIQLALENLAKEIDRKWGRGTWQQILQQRKKLLAEKAAAEQLAKENALKKAKADKIFWHNFWVEAGKVVLIILFAGIMIGFVYWAATAPKIR